MNLVEPPSQLADFLRPGVLAEDVPGLHALFAARRLVGAFIALFRGGDDEVLIRLAVLREIGARAEAPQWSPRELEARFVWLDRVKPETVLKRLRTYRRLRRALPPAWRDGQANQQLAAEWESVQAIERRIREIERRFETESWEGFAGMNDSDASGGQQVVKSLILLVALMMEESRPGGFVFVDEPFAHLDIVNIERVSAFLKATRARYLLTTPVTHNAAVYDPAFVTLVTSKKRPGEPWAPRIGVVVRQAAAD